MRGKSFRIGNLMNFWNLPQQSAFMIPKWIEAHKKMKKYGTG